MSDKKQRTKAILLVLFTVIICGLEAFTKGWSSLFWVPASMVILPVYIVISLIALSQKSGLYTKAIMRASYVLTLFLLLAYICTVGNIDASESIFFGFLRTEDHSLFTFSTNASHVAYYLTPVAFVVLVGLLIINRVKRVK
jgi:hypothetical protein